MYLACERHYFYLLSAPQPLVTVFFQLKSQHRSHLSIDKRTVYAHEHVVLLYMIKHMCVRVCGGWRCRLCEVEKGREEGGKRYRKNCQSWTSLLLSLCSLLLRVFVALFPFVCLVFSCQETRDESEEKERDEI